MYAGSDDKFFIYKGVKSKTCVGATRLTITDNFDLVPKLSRFAIDLYPVMKVLFESTTVKDTIIGGFGEVDGEF